MAFNKQNIYLINSGLVLALVGSYISLSPNEYLNQFGISPVPNASFYSDLRSMGGSLLIFGLVAIAGSLNKQLQISALFTTTLVFSAYSFFRLTAFVIDGTPSVAIIAATAIEIVFAFAGVALLAKYPKQLTSI